MEISANDSLIKYPDETTSNANSVIASLTIDLSSNLVYNLLLNYFRCKI